MTEAIPNDRQGWREEISIKRRLIIATGKKGIINMHNRMHNVVFKGLLTQRSLVEITNQGFLVISAREP